MSDRAGVPAKAMQLAYSELQATMLDEQARRRKAAKIIAVLHHFLGRSDLRGLRALDVGCSAGFISDELRLAGAQAIGLDVDGPGLSRAKDRFGDHIQFVSASADAVPLRSKSVDVVVFNHIYEHVPDPDAVVAEISRVLSESAVAYLGLGNRLGIMEPHYRLPFLSWLPPGLADAYVRRAGRASSYYETFRTRPGLRRMCASLTCWDYTYAVLGDPERFAADDMVPGPLRRAPSAFWRAISPVLPTYIWVATAERRRPQGPRLAVEPERI